jgi:hypothetical protein
MAKSKREELLEALYDKTLECLLAKIAEGNATAADLGVARQMLRDNNISAIPKDGNPLDKLMGSLPFEVEQEERDHYN